MHDIGQDLAFLISRGRLHPWLLITLLGIILAAFGGRFYCGYICPIFTVTGWVEQIKKLLGKKGKDLPGFAKSSYVRLLILFLFLASIFATAKLQLKIPIFLALLVVAVVIVIIYQPVFWHRYLCPLGLILNFTSRSASMALTVNQESCSGCDLCEKNCPGGAIKKTSAEGNKRIINPQYCLLCFACQKVCPQNAIFLTSPRSRLWMSKMSVGK